MLVGGRDVAATVDKTMLERGVANVNTFLDEMDAQYESRVRFRQPSEILLG